MTMETVPEKIGWLFETCGEVMAAVGKATRKGLDSSAIMIDLARLKRAIRSVELALDPNSRCPVCGELPGAEHDNRMHAAPKRDDEKAVAALGQWLWQEVTVNPGKMSSNIGSFWRDTADYIYRLGRAAGRVEARVVATIEPVVDREALEMMLARAWKGPRQTTALLPEYMSAHDREAVRNAAEAVYRRGFADGLLRRSVRSWRKLPDHNGKPVWTLRDDDEDRAVGVILWDMGAEQDGQDAEEAGAGAWMPMHEDAEVSRDLDVAMDQVEFYLGVIGAVRPEKAKT